MEDWELITKYLDHGSEEAFKEFALRHLSFVYSVAFKQTRNHAIAEDVTQAVFLALARKAPGLSRKVVLTGWLFRATLFASSNLQRAEQRRKHWELEAANMQSEFQPDSKEAVESQSLSDAVLLDAIRKLAAADQTVLALRFFQGMEFRKIGSELGLGEEAARKRVVRAVDKLRSTLRKQGFALPVTGLLAFLGTCQTQAAPMSAPALVTHIIEANSCAAASPTLALAKSTLQFMAFSKSKVIAATLCGLLLTTSGIVAYKLDKWEVISIRLWRASYDPASPKGALFSMRRALVSGDTAAYMDSFHLKAKDGDLKAALFQMANSFAALRKAAAAQYGSINANVLVRELAPVMPESAIHSARESSEDGRVFVEFGDFGPKFLVLEMSESGGRWRVLPETLFHAGSTAELIQDIQHLSKTINQMVPRMIEYRAPFDFQLAVKHELN